MRPDSITRQEQIRGQVGALADAGKDPAEIAELLGLTEARVDRILDHIEGAQPAVREPGEVIVRLVEPTPKAAAPPAPPRRRGVREPVHGTASGYQRHYTRREKPCQECRDAQNTAVRERKAAKRAAAVGDAS